MHLSEHSENFDRTLYAKIRQGDQNAYYQIFERYWERLFTIAKRISKSEDVAKDIIQDVFLSLWERREKTEIENIDTYLARATKFQALNVIRDSHHDVYDSLFAAESTVDESRVLEIKELTEDIEKAISDLPEKCQIVFRMSRIDHMTNDEIAAELNISKRTVETHISNALKDLRPKLLSSGIFIAICQQIFT